MDSFFPLPPPLSYFEEMDNYVSPDSGCGGELYYVTDIKCLADLVQRIHGFGYMGLGVTMYQFSRRGVNEANIQKKAELFRNSSVIKSIVTPFNMDGFGSGSENENDRKKAIEQNRRLYPAGAAASDSDGAASFGFDTNRIFGSTPPYSRIDSGSGGAFSNRYYTTASEKSGGANDPYHHDNSSSAIDSELDEDGSESYLQELREDLSKPFFHIGSSSDCLIGLYECGADRENVYRLVIVSYDVVAAKSFQSSMIRMKDRAFRDAKTPIQVSMIEDRKINQANLLDHKRYKASIECGELHRRAILYKILREMQIEDMERPVQEYCSTLGREVKVMSRNHILSDHKMYFLSMGAEYARFFCGAYSREEFHNNEAPYFLCPHIGFRAFVQNQAAQNLRGGGKDLIRGGSGDGVLNGDPASFSPKGMPIRIKTLEAQSNVFNSTPFSHIKAEERQKIEERVKWSDGGKLSVMLAADQDLYEDANQDFNTLVSKYRLEYYSSYLWRTIVVYIAPPEIEKDLPLLTILEFSTKSVVEIPQQYFREIYDAYMTLVEYPTVLDLNAKENQVFISPHKIQALQEIFPAKMIKLRMASASAAGGNIGSGGASGFSKSAAAATAPPLLSAELFPITGGKENYQNALALANFLDSSSGVNSKIFQLKSSVASALLFETESLSSFRDDSLISASASPMHQSSGSGGSGLYAATSSSESAASAKNSDYNYHLDSTSDIMFYSKKHLFPLSKLFLGQSDDLAYALFDTKALKTLFEIYIKHNDILQPLTINEEDIAFDELSPLHSMADAAAFMAASAMPPPHPPNPYSSGVGVSGYISGGQNEDYWRSYGNGAGGPASFSSIKAAAANYDPAELARQNVIDPSMFESSADESESTKRLASAAAAKRNGSASGGGGRYKASATKGKQAAASNHYENHNSNIQNGFDSPPQSRQSKTSSKSSGGRKSRSSGGQIRDDISSGFSSADDVAGMLYQNNSDLDRSAYYATAAAQEEMAKSAMRQPQQHQSTKNKKQRRAMNYLAQNDHYSAAAVSSAQQQPPPQSADAKTGGGVGTNTAAAAAKTKKQPMFQTNSYYDDGGESDAAVYEAVGGGYEIAPSEDDPPSGFFEPNDISGDESLLH